MSEWKEYFRDRLVKKIDDFFVIVPKDNVSEIPLSCCLCTSLYRNVDDAKSHNEFGCCHMCALRWAHANKERWNSGFRPSSDDIKLDVEQRAGINVSFDIDVW